MRAQMEQILSRHTGQDVATLRADTDRDKIFTAEQAVAYGLADTSSPCETVLARPPHVSSGR